MAVSTNRLEDYETNWTNIQNLKHKINIDLVQQVLDERRNVNFLIHEGFTPLYLASMEGDSRLVGSLLDRGAEVNVPSKDGKTPLYVASKNGHLDIVKILLASGAEVNLISLPTDCKETCLNVAWKHGHYEVVKVLLEKGAKTNHIPETEANYKALDKAVRNGQAELVTLLLKNGLRVNWVNPRGNNLLDIACSVGHLNIVNILLDLGIDIFCPSTFVQTPVHIACANNHFAIAKVLLERGAETYNRTFGSRQCLIAPLYLVAKEGMTDLVRLMLNNGADVNKPINPVDGQTPLQIACEMGHYDTVRLLLDRGANVNLCTQIDLMSLHNYQQAWFTPLLLALQRGHSRVARLLLERGAQVNRASQPTGESALWLCCREGNYDMVKLLLEYGANPNQIKCVGDLILMSPLYIATCEGHRSIVRLLLENGAIINLDRGEPNLLLAAYIDGHYDIFMDFFNFIDKKKESLQVVCGREDLLFAGYDTNHYDIVDACVERCAKTSCLKNEAHFMVLEPHLQKLKAVGLFGDVSSADQALLDSYNMEIKNIKSFKVYNNVSLYVVFRLFHAPYYLRNQDLLTSLETYLNSQLTMEMFPFYGQILRNRLLSSKYRLTLLTKVSQGLEGQEWWDKLHLPIQHNILIHVDNSDLEKMCGN